MNQAICTKCGADLIPETSFCRQCGQPVSSEQVTATLNNSREASTTKRLEPRPTTPRYEVDSAPLDSSSASASLSKPGILGRRLVTAGIVLSLLAVSAAVIWSLKIGNRGAASPYQVSRSLVYPGARTIVDMADSGGAVLQLESDDALETVSQWYEANLKPTKTLRATSNSVIQKREKMTVTLVSDDKITSIVIKQAH